MMKHAISEKGKEKQLEKEIPWQLIPPDERQLYREAEQKQWDEHLQFGAVKPSALQRAKKSSSASSPTGCSIQDSFTETRTMPNGRWILACLHVPKHDFALLGRTTPIWGRSTWQRMRQLHPNTPSFLALQLALNRGWKVSVGDIRAAFLNGIPAPRELYFRQPKRGIPGLQPGQLIEVLKGVFWDSALALSFGG